MDEDNTNTIKINKKQLWKYSTFLLFAVAVIGGFFMFTENGSSGITGNIIAVGGAGEIVEIKTVIQDFKYNPDTITVKKGSIVRLTIENKDNVLHGLHLPQFGIQDGTQPFSTKTVQFTATVETAANGQAIPTCTQEHGETLTFNVV